MTNNSPSFLAIHESYKRIMFMLSVDLSFWQHFISQWAIPEYQKQFGDKLLHSAGYAVYDHSPVAPEARLKMATDVHNIHTRDLPAQSYSLFSWIQNKAHVRAYNALELLLLETINLAYLDSTFDVHAGRKSVNGITAKIGELLPETRKDRNNNKQLIQFLRTKCPALDTWLKLPVRVDLPTNWEEFFELASRLRHCVTHQAMIMHKNNHNEIKTNNSHFLFDRCFELVSVDKDTYELRPVQSLFANWLNYYMEFAATTLKLVADEPDLQFLGLFD